MTDADNLIKQLTVTAASEAGPMRQLLEAAVTEITDLQRQPVTSRLRNARRAKGKSDRQIARLESDLRLQHEIRVELEAKLASARQALMWAANMIPCSEHEREILLAGTNEPEDDPGELKPIHLKPLEMPDADW